MEAAHEKFGQEGRGAVMVTGGEDEGGFGVWDFFFLSFNGFISVLR